MQNYSLEYFFQQVNAFILYVYGCFVLMYVYVPHVFLVPKKAIKKALDPWIWSYRQL